MSESADKSVSECFAVLAVLQDSRQSTCRHRLVDRCPVRLGGHEARAVHSTVQGLASRTRTHTHTPHKHILPRFQDFRLESQKPCMSKCWISGRTLGRSKAGPAANLPVRLVVRSHSGLNELGVHAEARLLRRHRFEATPQHPWHIPKTQRGEAPRVKESQASSRQDAPEPPPCLSIATH